MTGIKIRQATKNDLPDLLHIDEEIWPNFRASEEVFLSRIEIFPRGQLVATIDGRVVGSLFTLRINFTEWEGRSFSWNQITDNGTFQTTYRSHGTDLYGVGIAVLKEFQGTGAADRLMIGAGRIVLQENLRAIYLGARMPGYHKHPGMSPDEYIALRRNGRSIDPEIRLYESAGLSVVKLLPDYVDDPASSNFGVLMVRRNPFGKISGSILGKIVGALSEESLGRFLNI